ncbi:MAG: PDZ domain-containing protein [Gemmatimonadetes bacterium]|nr:PDZ domain-containing protein [Gemmatimonadota bacterium]
MRPHARLLMNDRFPAIRTSRLGRSTILASALLVASLPVTTLGAQDVRILTRPDADRRVVIRDGQMPDGERRLMVFGGQETNDRPMIGVTTVAESERGDTLGLRIESVQRGSPAEKAGLKAGDRVQAVNGVSLRADRVDAGEDDYSGVLNRRLQREVQRTAPGTSIDLRVLTDGQSRTVKVTPVKASDLETEVRRGFSWTGDDPDRAVLGVTVAGTGSARDTLGVFVQSVAHDGPAEKAGVVEGDRIAAINGVSLRVSREDADDESVGASRAERLSREVAKLKAGDAAELTVVTGGRSRTVRVTTGKASDLPEGGEGATFMRVPMEGMLRELPRMRELPPMRELPDQAMPNSPSRMRIEAPSRVVIRRTVRTES